jgi:hypothetical protein
VREREGSNNIIEVATCQYLQQCVALLPSLTDLLLLKIRKLYVDLPSLLEFQRKSRRFCPLHLDMVKCNQN